MNILIVDDKKRFAEILAEAVAQEMNLNVQTACSAEEAVALLDKDAPDIVVTDLRMPGMDGLSLLGEIKRRSRRTEVILMTAFADVPTAKETLKRGAVDYMVKPFDNDELFRLIEQIMSRYVAHPDVLAENSGQHVFMGMIGTSRPMRKLFEDIERIADAHTSVLILGESGTGKELVSRAIHNISSRRNGPFVPVHCAAVPESLLESVFFGHEKGAFTGAQEQKKGQFEAANNGTVFLDEIGEMPLALQPKLLRFLQEHHFNRVGGTQTIPVDVRILAATHRDLSAEVAAGTFREDLFYRLEGITLRIPALRDRAEDIPLLLRHFLTQKNLDPNTFSDHSVKALMDYNWPGNIRELQNVIEHALFSAGKNRIEISDLPDKIHNRHTGNTAANNNSEHTSLTLQQNEKEMIIQALRKSGNNKTRAAKFLGITRRKLYSRMKVLDIDPDLIFGTDCT